MDYSILLIRLDCFALIFLLAAAQRFSDNTTNPFIIDHPEDQYAARNDPVTLNCRAEGNPPPVITWYRNGQQVITANENASSNRVLLPNGQLVLLRVVHGGRTGRSDSGVYYCNATNPETKFSVISRNATLDIAVIRDEFQESPPPKREVAVGMETVLTCRPPKGEPEPKVKWKKNGRPFAVAGDHRIYIDDSGSLTIRAVQKDDAGSYVCVGYNIAGERESTPTKLFIREKPRITESPQDMVVKENFDVTFECEAIGDPYPTVLWRRQGAPISPDRSRIMNDRSLRIERAQVGDEGVYVCRAENSVGHQEAEARLTVHSIPKFVRTPQSMAVGIGRQVTFFCEVEGNPYPTLFWNKELSQMFMFPNSDHGRFVVTEDGRLIIRSLQLEDAGQYTCQALNIAGSASSKATLTVTGADSRLPPIIQHGPHNQTLPVSAPAILFCSATGNPLPTIVWMKNGKLLPRTDPRFSIVDGGSLQISDLRRADVGLYTCMATSETGESSRSAMINVEATTDSAIVFNRSPQLSALPGAPTKLTVSNATETALTLSWKANHNFGATAVTSFSVEYFSPDTGEGWITATEFAREPSFVISNLRPNTRYVFLVRARNPHGLGAPSQPSTPEKTLGSNVMTPVTTVPDLDLNVVLEKISGQIITSLSAAALSSTAVNVTWKTLHSWNYIEGFYIKYRPVENSNSVEKTQREEYMIDVIHSNMAVQFILTGLQKFKWYDVCVQPFYRTVKGSTSNTVRIQTLEDVPSAPPTNVNVRLIDNITLFVTWSQPPVDKIYGQLLGYKIYVYGDELRLIREIQVNATMEAISIHNLAKNSKYSVQMSAYNKMGEGARSDTLSASEQTLVNEPWFLATLIGTIGGILWVSLCLFSLMLYRKHRANRKMKNGSDPASNSKSHDNHQLNPIRGELPYSLGHQLMTSSTLKPCPCNQPFVSSCCYNESLSDGEYKMTGEQLTTNHTYHSLESPMAQTSADPNLIGSGKPSFNSKNPSLITPYATVPVDSGYPDNPQTPDGVFRPIPPTVCDGRVQWNPDIDLSQCNNIVNEDRMHRLNAGHPAAMQQPVIFLPPPPSHSPTDDSTMESSWTLSKIQPPVYNLSNQLHQINKSHCNVMPSPRQKNVGFAEQRSIRTGVSGEVQADPKYASEQPLLGPKGQHHPGFQPSDYAIKPEQRRLQQFTDNSTDSDSFSTGYYTFIKP